MTIPDPAGGTSGPAVQYPSHITVSGLTGILSSVVVTMKNVTHTAAQDLDVLLVGPGGQNIVLLSDTGTSASNITLNVDDAAPSQLTTGAVWGPSGTTVNTKPVDNTGIVDFWPAPAPASGYNHAAPEGSSTLTSIFSTTNPNGVWSLYILDDAGGDSGVMAGGWALTFTMTTTLTWNGAGSANWATAGNWSPAVTPSSLLDVVIPASGVTHDPTISASDVTVNNLTVAAGRTLTVNSGRTVNVNGTAIVNGNFGGSGGAYALHDLTIGNAAGVTPGGNVTVSGTLALTSGDLNMGANTLTMPNTAVSTGGFDVIGAVKRTGFTSAPNTLSFGNPNNQLTFTAGTLPTDITVSLAKSAPAGFSTAVQRTYTITPNPSNLSGFTATLRLHYLDAELNGNTPESSLSLRRYTGANWTPYPATTPVDTSNNWVENNAVHNFSPWTLSKLAPTAATGIISGVITRADGMPIEGAVVRLSGAQSRKTITDGNGNYQFDNVEANGFYTVTPSRANYNFNPFNRSFSLVGNKTEAAFSGVSLGDNVNPIDTAEYFVRRQYVDVLGREPDEAGFNYWSDQLLACGEDVQCTSTRRRDVAAAFFIEPEAQQTGVFVYDLYAAALGRRPAFAEYAADRRQVVGGADLDSEKLAFAQSFVTRPEFLAKYQSNVDGQSFIDALIRNAQLSGIDLSDERSNLLTAYQNSAEVAGARAAVVSAIADDAAFKQQEFNSAFVLTEYFAYLRRDPDPGGYEFWLNVLNNGDGGNYRGMVCSFVTAREYQQRFSVVVTRSNAECSR